MIQIDKFGVLKIMDELDGLFDNKSEDTLEIADGWESAF